MTKELFVVLAVALAFCLSVFLAAKRTTNRNQDIQRQLLSIENKLYLTKNFLAMSQLTTHGEQDRETYIYMAETEMRDALMQVRTLQKEVYDA